MSDRKTYFSTNGSGSAARRLSKIGFLAGKTSKTQRSSDSASRGAERRLAMGASGQTSSQFAKMGQIIPITTMQHTPALLAPQQRQDRMLNDAIELLQVDMERFDFVVRKLLTMLSNNSQDFTAIERPLRPFGLAEGQMVVPDNFNDPMTDAELAEFYGE